jgi:hypothetical protein
MKFLYSFFSLCLLLFAVACSKDKAAPQPELTGRWEGKFTFRTGYNPSGQVVSRDTLSADDLYMVITQNAISYYLKSTGANIATAAYARQGNTIQYPNALPTPAATPPSLS